MVSASHTRSDSKALNTRRVLILLVALASVVLAIHAQANPPTKPAAVDTSKWECQFCAYTYGWNGQLDVGLGNVSSSSYKFGEYTGLEKSGLYLLLGGDAAYRDKDGHYINVVADNLGIASRDLSMGGGKQGLYELTAEFQEIPQFIANSGRTPFLGIGSDTLTLPSNWVPGGATGQMTSLNRDLRPVDIENTRRITTLGVKVMPPKSHWHFTVHFQRDTRNGTEALGGNFLTTTTLLPEAMHYRTDQVRASAEYDVAKWQVGFGYYGSFFQDADTALTWNNPFLPITPGATQGQMGTPPSNNYNALSFSGAWQAWENTRLMATASVGRGTQNATFLASTLNTQLSPAALPRSSLDGEMDTVNYALRAYSYVLPGLNLTADYTVDKHDNHTPQAAYQQVITDTYIADYAINVPYSFSRELGRVIADYRLSSHIHLEGGGSYEDDDRTFLSAASTQTNSLWASIRANPVSSVSTFLQVMHERRYSPDYSPIDDLFASQNPLLRQFDLADRTRNQVKGQVSYAPDSKWSAGVSAEDDDDQYTGTTIGLTQSKDLNYTLSLTYTPSSEFDINGYFTQERIAWRQANSEDFAAPDWYADQEDAIQTVGLSAELRNIKPGLDGGVNFSYSLARGDTVIMTGASIPAFPNLTMRTQSLSVYTKYTINQKWGLRVAYQIERYATTDWSLDGVNPSTISNVLALGIYSPNYVVNVVSITAQYSF